MEKASVPIDMRCSKTSLLKLPKSETNCKYCFITLMILTFLVCIFCVQFPFPSTRSGTPKNYFFEMSPYARAST